MNGKLDYIPHSYDDFEYGFTFGTQFGQIKAKMLTLVETILNNQTTEDDACDGGLYSGPGGIAYMFLHLIKTPDILTPSEKIKIIPMVQKFLNVQLLYYSKLREMSINADSKSEYESLRVGFLTGDAGVFAVGAILAQFLGNEDLKSQCLQEFIAAGEIAENLRDFDGKGSNGLFTGRAGYLCGALCLNQYLGYQPVPVESLYAIWQAIVASGRKQAKSRKIKEYPLSFTYCNEEYIGASHGVSSILQILLSWPQFLESDKAAEKDIKATVHYLFNLLNEFQNGYFPCTMKDVYSMRKGQRLESINPDGTFDTASHPLQWCHGMPGLAFLLAKVGIRYKIHEYLKFCLKIANSLWVNGLTTKGPGLCHGIAGNAYVFLLVYRLTEYDARYLYRAVRFGEFIFTNQFQKNSEQSENPYSLFEGLAGTVCFLSDLLHPQQSEFPFFNVFYDPNLKPEVSRLAPPLIVEMVQTPEFTLASTTPATMPMSFSNNNNNSASVSVSQLTSASPPVPEPKKHTVENQSVSVSVTKAQSLLLPRRHRKITQTNKLIIPPPPPLQNCGSSSRVKRNDPHPYEYEPNAETRTIKSKSKSKIVPSSILENILTNNTSPSSSSTGSTKNRVNTVNERSRTPYSSTKIHRNQNAGSAKPSNISSNANTNIVMIPNGIIKIEDSIYEDERGEDDNPFLESDYSTQQRDSDNNEPVHQSHALRQFSNQPQSILPVNLHPNDDNSDENENDTEYDSELYGSQEEDHIIGDLPPPIEEILS